MSSKGQARLIWALLVIARTASGAAPLADLRLPSLGQCVSDCPSEVLIPAGFQRNLSTTMQQPRSWATCPQHQSFAARRRLYLGDGRVRSPRRLLRFGRSYVPRRLRRPLDLVRACPSSVDQAKIAFHFGAGLVQICTCVGCLLPLSARMRIPSRTECAGTRHTVRARRNRFSPRRTSTSGAPRPTAAVTRIARAPCCASSQAPQPTLPPGPWKV
jgi:hypothetical protein